MILVPVDFGGLVKRELRFGFIAFAVLLLGVLVGVGVWI